MTATLVSRWYVSAPRRTRTYNLLIKRTLHTHTHGRKWAHIKDIAKPARFMDATECPQSATQRHDIRHDTSHPLPGGNARRVA